MKRHILSVVVAISLIFSMCSMTALAEETDTPLFEGTLRTSVDGIEMIQDLEGFIGKPWHDVSQYSIGYGCSTAFAERYGFPTDELSREQAHQLMLFVLDEMENYVDNFLAKHNVTVNQYQYDALVSLTYNLGRTWLTSTSRLGKLLIEGGYSVNELASAFGIYCHTGTGKNAVVQDHLVTRRIREAKLFLYGAYNLSDVEEKFCRLTYEGNVPPDYTDVAIYQEGQPYQILFEPDPEDATGPHFVGWYTEDGRKLTAEDIVEDSLTVHAEWSDTYEEPETRYFPEAYVSPTQPVLTEKTYVNGVCGDETTVNSGGSNVDTPVYEYKASDAFTDMFETDWHYPYINALYNQGIINGYEDNTFRPQKTVTTGEALKMILLAAGYDDPGQVTDHWASGYHYLALDWGIIDSGEIVDLDVPIRRELVAKIAANALGIERLYDGAVYTDTDNKYACALYDWGITEGYEDNTFRPERSLTRAELSAIVWRINDIF